MLKKESAALVEIVTRGPYCLQIVEFMHFTTFHPDNYFNEKSRRMLQISRVFTGSKQTGFLSPYLSVRETIRRPLRVSPVLACSGVFYLLSLMRSEIA
jgi:hypothetical protein